MKTAGTANGRWYDVILAARQGRNARRIRPGTSPIVDGNWTH